MDKTETTFDFSQLKQQTVKELNVATTLTRKHNPGLDETSEVFYRIRNGFVKDIQFLVEAGLIKLL